MARLDRGRRLRRVTRAALATALGLTAAARAGADTLPRVVSTNLCTDQLVLSLADASQIVSVSWLAADPHESVMPAAAARYPLNYGTAEELLRLKPDVVIGGVYTRAFTLGLLARLGLEVVSLEPAESLADIERSVETIGAAIGQHERAAALVARMRGEARAIAARAPAVRPAAMVVRPGGYTVGAGSLAHELMRLAGLDNLAADQGLDRWGSLSIESLLTSRPDLLVLIDYHGASPSLANAVLRHPALRRLEQRVPSVRIDAARLGCGLPQSLEAARALQAAALELGRR